MYQVKNNFVLYYVYFELMIVVTDLFIILYVYYPVPCVDQELFENCLLTSIVEYGGKMYQVKYIVLLYICDLKPEMA